MTSKKSIYICMSLLIAAHTMMAQSREVFELTTWKFQKASQENGFEVNFDDSKWETTFCKLF